MLSLSNSSHSQYNLSMLRGTLDQIEQKPTKQQYEKINHHACAVAIYGLPQEKNNVLDILFEKRNSFNEDTPGYQMLNNLIENFKNRIHINLDDNEQPPLLGM